MADAPPRLFESDLTSIKELVPFNGTSYKMRVQLTAFGGITNQATDFVALLTTHELPAACADHYRKIVARCSDLKHCNKQLRDHIQVCLYIA
jgi:hypothetical protein